MGGGERVEQRGPVLHTFRARGMRVYAPKAEGRRAERERERERDRFRDRPEELWYEVVGHDGAVGIVCLYNVCAAAAELQTSR